MSAKKDGDFSHTEDVSHAWDSLLEAKKVLQRIENKMNTQENHQRFPGRIRRRLSLDRTSRSGQESRSPIFAGEEKRRWREETFSVDRSPDRHHTFSSPTVDIEHGGSDEASYPRVLPHEEQNQFSNSGVGVFPTQYCINPGDSMTVKGYPNMDNRSSSEGRYSDAYKIPCPMEEVTEDIPDPCLEVSPDVQSASDNGDHVPPERDRYREREYRRSRSPDSKLEKLKEKIREQRRRHDTLKEKPLNPWPEPQPVKNHILKRKVCKMTSVPPSRACRGLRGAQKDPAISHSNGPAEHEEFKGSRKGGKGNNSDPHQLVSKERIKKVKSRRSPVSRKLSFDSPSPEKKSRRADLYGPSAWREGQKLVRRILGPSPVYNPPREAADMNSDKGVTSAGQGGSSGNRGKKSPPRDQRKDLPRREAKHVQTDTGDSVHKGPDKENVTKNEGKPPKSRKAPRYSAEEVRDFMKKKNMERVRKEREDKSLRQKAAQLRQKRLQDVFKKQKDAFPPRSNGVVPPKNIRRPPRETPHPTSDGKNISEWVKSNTWHLLKEEEDRSRKCRAQPHEEPNHGECLSPLRLQDLDTINMALDKNTTSKREKVVRSTSASPKRAPELSPRRNSQERLRTIWVMAKELGERVDLEASRLDAKQGPRDADSNGRSGSHQKGCPTFSPNTRLLSGPTSVLPQFNPCEGEGNGVANKWLAVDGASIVNIVDASHVLYPRTGRAVSDDVIMKPFHANKGNIGGQVSPAQKSYRSREPSPVSRSLGSPKISPKYRSGALTETATGSELKSPKARRKKISSPYSPNTCKGKKEEAHSIRPLEEQLTSMMDWHPIKMDLLQNIKMQIAQQEQELTTLQQRVRGDAREAERCMEEVRKRKADRYLTNEKSVGLDHKPSARLIQTAGRSSPSDGILGGSANPAGITAPTKPNITPKKPFSDGKSGGIPSRDSAGKEPAGNVSEHTEPATDSTSKWSEISEFYGSPNMFRRFNLEMAQQYLREEELRARHQAALLRLRQEAILEKAKAELALLEHQRKCLEMKNEPSRLVDILRRELEIKTNLKQEQAEIRHLHNIYKSAHRERKLLLKQQKEILSIHQATARMQKELLTSGDPRQSADDTLCRSLTSSEWSNQDTHADVSDLAEDDVIVEESRLAANDSRRVPEEEVSTQRTPQAKRTPNVSENNDEGNTSSDGHPIYQDGAAEAYPSSAVQEPMMETVDNNHGNLHQRRLPTASGNLRHHSQKPEASVDDDDGDDGDDGDDHVADVGDGDDGDDDDGDDESTLGGSTSETKVDFPCDLNKNPEGANPDPIVAGGGVGKAAEDGGQRQNFGTETEAEGMPFSDVSHEGYCFSRTSDDPPEIKTKAAFGASKADKLCPSLEEFLKVSAKLVRVSESSGSLPGKAEDAQDTESGDSEVFDMESSEFFCEMQDAEPEGPLSIGDPSSAKSTDRSSSPLKGQISMECSAISRQKEPLGEASDSPDIENKTNKNENDCKDVEEDYQGDDDDGGLSSLPSSSSSHNEGDHAKEPKMADTLVSGQNKTECVNTKAPLASESFPTSPDMSESEASANAVVYIIEEMSRNEVRITDTQDSTSMSPEDISNVGDTKDRQMETNEGQYFADEKVISEKIEKVPFQAGSSKDLFGIKSFTLRNEGDVTFITEEVLQPIEENLSEILSPVDEMLSYGSADLCSAKKDFSYRSDDLPSLPEDGESIKSNDVDSEDFPSPPEQIASDSLQSHLEGSIADEIHTLYDELLTEEALLPPDDIKEGTQSKDEKLAPVEFPGKENSDSSGKVLKPFLTLSKAEEDHNDPLFTFEIGDRVLVKLSKPGTLKFKGLTSFGDGYWAGVALDTAEGDHNGTYDGVKYFECPMKCGIFVRPRQISHLLYDDKSTFADDDDDDDDDLLNDPPNSGKGRSNQAKEDNYVAEEKEGGEGENRRPLDTNENKSRSCCCKSPDCGSPVSVADINQHVGVLGDSPTCDLQKRNEDKICEVIEPQRKTLCIKSMPPEDTQGLVLRLCEDLLSDLLRETMAHFAEIGQQKYQSTNKNEYRVSSKNEQDERQTFLLNRPFHAPSLEAQSVGTSEQAKSISDQLVIQIIRDSIKEYKKLKTEEGGGFGLKSCDTSPCVLAEMIHNNSMKDTTIRHREAAEKTRTADAIFQSMLADSMKLIGNIYWKKTRQGLEFLCLSNHTSKIPMN